MNPNELSVMEKPDNAGDDTPADVKIKMYEKQLDLYTQSAHHSGELNHLLMNEHVQFPQIPPGVISMLQGHAETMVRRFKGLIETERKKLE